MINEQLIKKHVQSQIKRDWMRDHRLLPIHELLVSMASDLSQPVHTYLWLWTTIKELEVRLGISPDPNAEL